MSRTIDTKTLNGIFQMVSNVSDRVKFTWGTPPDDAVNFLLRACVAPVAMGALDSKAILQFINQRAADRSDAGSRKALTSVQFRFSSTADTDPSPGIDQTSDPRTLVTKKFSDGRSTDVYVPITMREAISRSANTSDYDSCPTSFFLSNMPFLSPIVGRAADVEVFLNFLPSYVASRMVPYLDVEFQFTRPYKDGTSRQLSTTGLQKFLDGAIQFNTPARTADDVMAHGHQLRRGTEQTRELNGKTLSQNLERSYAGMEIFTSPQTLVNFEQLDPSMRYNNVLDPTRPLMTLLSLQLDVAPTVGYSLNKTGSMVLKLHDRSRLAEVGDLLQPEIYTRTVLWLTYGWIYPIEQDDAYSAFINNNLMVRELYGIKNSSYVFENDGQVTITLQLYTMGATELMDLKITAGANPLTGDVSYDSVQQQINELSRMIGFYANRLGLNGSEGTSTPDIRAYQIINNAARGEFPNLADTKVTEALTKLRESLVKNTRVNQDDVAQLITSLETLYRNDGKNYNIDNRRKLSIDSIIAERINQLCDNERDPWLPIRVPGAGADSCYAPSAFSEEIEKALRKKNLYVNKESKDNKSFIVSKSGVCSFAKLIATFVAPQVAELGICHEFQVFFYAFNESAALASGQCIANFPIDVGMFLDQFAIHVQQIGTSKMSVAEFIKFVIDAQLSDQRSLGYGTRDYYKPYKSGEAATLIDDKKVQEQFEGFMNAHMSKWGPFHIPAIDTYIEMVPLVSNPDEVVDVMQDVALDRSAKDTVSASGGSFRKSMKNRYALRMHIYDKQLNPYKSVETALKPATGKPGHFILVSSNEDAMALARRVNNGSADAVRDLLVKLANQELTDTESKLLAELSNGTYVPMDLSSNKKVKDYVSSIVPTILFGANGSILSSAQLTTQQNALLGATQQMKQSGRVNPQTPAGAGPSGLPITIIPGQLTMNTLGCPIAALTQRYFVDFNTGTTADNVYCVSKLTHSFTPGKFETSWTFVWSDAYGRIAGANDVTKYLEYINRSIQDPPSQEKNRK